MQVLAGQADHQQVTEAVSRDVPIQPAADLTVQQQGLSEQPAALQQNATRSQNGSLSKRAGSETSPAEHTGEVQLAAETASVPNLPHSTPVTSYWHENLSDPGALLANEEHSGLPAFTADDHTHFTTVSPDLNMDMAVDVDTVIRSSAAPVEQPSEGARTQAAPAALDRSRLPPAPAARPAAAPEDRQGLPLPAAPEVAGIAADTARPSPAVAPEALPVTSAEASDRQSDGDTSEDASDKQMSSTCSDGRRMSAEESQAAKQRRKRRQLAPSIPKSARCGTCHTCLNPQLKKACLTRRKELEEQAKREGRSPDSLQADPPRPAKPSPGKKQKTLADFSALDDELGSPRRYNSPASSSGRGQSSFEHELDVLINADGGVVDLPKVPHLVKLMKQEKGYSQRVVLLAVLGYTSEACLRSLINSTHKGLSVLEDWLGEAVKAGDKQLVRSILATLTKLPVSVGALQTCTIGKTVTKLKKSDDAVSRDKAGAVIDAWKEMVKSTTGVAPPAGAKRNREQIDLSQAKRPKQEGMPIKAGDKQGSLQRQTSTERSAAAHAGTNGVARPGAGPMQAGSGSTQAAGEAVGMPMEVDDDAMFQRPKPKGGSLRDHVQQPRKTHQLKLLDEEDGKQLLKERAVAASKDVKPALAGDQEHQPGSNVKADSAPGTSVLATTGPHVTSLAIPSSTPQTTKIGTTNLSVTRIGSFAPSFGSSKRGVRHAPFGAAARAEQARLRVPSPEPRERVEKKKKLSWANEDDLQHVRWFKQTDAPVAVKEDAVWTAEDEAAPASAEADLNHPEFVSAAKREHENEAQALRLHGLHDEEDGEDAGGDMEAMGAILLPWHPPPPVLLPAEFGLATGEESTEATAQAERMRQVMPAVYRDAASLPNTPAEPMSNADALYEPAQPLALIPLSLPVPEQVPMQAQPEFGMQAQHGVFLPAPGQQVPGGQFPGMQPPLLSQAPMQSAIGPAPGYPVQSQPFGQGQPGQYSGPLGPAGPNPFMGQVQRPGPAGPPPQRQGQPGPSQGLPGAPPGQLLHGLPHNSAPPALHAQVGPPGAPQQAPGVFAMQQSAPLAGPGPQHMPPLHQQHQGGFAGQPSASAPPGSMQPGPPPGAQHSVQHGGQPGWQQRPPVSGQHPAGGGPGPSQELPRRPTVMRARKATDPVEAPRPGGADYGGQGQGRGPGGWAGPPRDDRLSGRDSRPRGYGGRICKFFNTPGGCRLGDRCSFTHVTEPSSAGRSGPDSGTEDNHGGDRQPGRFSSREESSRTGRHEPRRTGWDDRGDSGDQRRAHAASHSEDGDEKGGGQYGGRRGGHWDSGGGRGRGRGRSRH